MVVMLIEKDRRVIVPSWNAVCENIVNSLDVERFLDLGVRSQIQMDQDQASNC